MADPLSLALAGLTAGASALFGSRGSSGPSTPAAPALPPAAPPVQSPTGSAGSNKPQQAPSFLAAAAAPNQNQQSGTKSLLGQ